MMEHTVATIVSQLENTADPETAFFSFSVDESGERGVIKANAAGLRLYAAELLKKVQQMEQAPCSRLLCFEPKEWMVSDAGYDLITGVQPCYETRRQLQAPATQKAVRAITKNRFSQLFFTVLITGLLVLFACALYWFH